MGANDTALPLDDYEESEDDESDDDHDGTCSADLDKAIEDADLELANQLKRRDDERSALERIEAKSRRVQQESDADKQDIHDQERGKDQDCIGVVHRTEAKETEDAVSDSLNEQLANLVIVGLMKTRQRAHLFRAQLQEMPASSQTACKEVDYVLTKPPLITSSNQIQC